MAGGRGVALAGRTIAEAVGGGALLVAVALVLILGQTTGSPIHLPADGERTPMTATNPHGMIRPMTGWSSSWATTLATKWRRNPQIVETCLVLGLAVAVLLVVVGGVLLGHEILPLDRRR